MTGNSKQPVKDGDAPLSPDNEGQTKTAQQKKPAEFGGRKGPEPTRYGDWEKNGIISDF